jgi:hypothetical protein
MDFICINCASSSNNTRLPPPLRLQRRAEFSFQIQRESIQRARLEAALAIQHITEERENRIRQEEITLLSIVPQDMTARQTRRLLQLYIRLQEETVQLQVVITDGEDRLERLRRAISRIPTQHIRDLSEFEFITYFDALLRDMIEITARYPGNEEAIRATAGIRARQQLLQEELDRDRNEREVRRLNRAQREEISRLKREERAKAIATILTQVHMESIDEKDCSICGDPFGTSSRNSEDELTENPVRIPCGHIYCGDCIKTWLADSSTCPLCRRDFAIELTGVEPESDTDTNSEEALRQDQTVIDEAREILERMEVLRLSGDED